MSSDSNPTVTGCSSGIGRATAALVASKPGQRLIATARNPESLSYLPDGDPNILKLALDVTSPSSVNAAFAAATEHFGGGDRFHLDAVVKNAGYSLSGDVESATEEGTHRGMETLFFGTARVTTRAIEVMRQLQTAEAASFSTCRRLPGCAPFRGMHTITREMHPDWNSKPSSQEVSRGTRTDHRPVNFCIVEPSGVKKDFEGHSKAHTKPHPAYAADDMPVWRLEAYVRMGTRTGIGMVEPSAIAEAIFITASPGERVPLRLPLGATAWKLAKVKFEGLLQDLDAVKEISTMCQQI